MPTYQYACTDCGHRLEAVQSFTDAALTECPECGGTLRKVFSAVGVVFKGSGFYRTDSRESGRKTSAPKSAKSESTTSGKETSTAKEATTKSGTSASSGDAKSKPVAASTT